MCRPARVQLGMGSTAPTTRPENPGPGRVGLALRAGLGLDFLAQTSGWAGFGLQFLRFRQGSGQACRAEPGFASSGRVQPRYIGLTVGPGQVRA
jgi:hypothetical protein